MRGRALEDRLLVAIVVVAVASAVSAVTATGLAVTCARGCRAEAAAAAFPAAAPVVPAPVPHPDRAAPQAGSRSAGGAGRPVVQGLALGARVAAAARASGSATLSITGAGRGGRISGGGVVSYPAGGRGQAVDLAVAMRIRTDRVRMVLAGRQSYFAPPQPLAGRDWIRTPRRPGTPLLRTWEDVVDGVSDAAEPWRSAWGGATVEGRGAAVVRGVRTTRYVIRTTGAGSGAAGGRPTALFTTLGLGRPGTVTTELYLDGRDLPVLVVTTAGEGATRATTVVSFSRWGAPVTIVPPSPAGVIDAETVTT